MLSLVLLATPPSSPPLGDGLIKAFFLIDNSGILVLSPKIEPPVFLDDGSTAKTATL